MRCIECGSTAISERNERTTQGYGQIGKSWYVDETYIKVHGQWRYLYRAIDRSGALVDVMFSEHRDMAAAKAGSVSVCASKCSLRSDRRARSIRRLPGWPLRSQCDGESGACGCWRKYVDEGGSGDAGGYAIHRSLDRTGQPIVGT